MVEDEMVGWHHQLMDMNLSKLRAPNSSTLAWKVPWPEEPGGTMSLQRVGHDLATEQQLR